MVNFDNLLKEINDFGIYQKLRYALICLAALLPPIVTYMQSFIAPKHPYRCKNPFFENDSYSINHFADDSITSAGLVKLDRCSITYQNNSTEVCKEWVFDRTYYQKTLTEEVK